MLGSLPLGPGAVTHERVEDRRVASIPHCGVGVRILAKVQKYLGSALVRLNADWSQVWNSWTELMEQVAVLEAVRSGLISAYEPGVRDFLIEDVEHVFMDGVSTIVNVTV